MLRWLPVPAFLAVCLATPVSPQQGDTLWLMWESTEENCWRGNCAPQRRLTSHFLTDLPKQTAERLFTGMAPLAAVSGTPNIVHQELPFCNAAPPPPTVVNAAPLTFIDTTGMEPVPAVDTLEGLVGVFADFRGLRGPPGYVGNFGQEAQDFFLAALAEAGIPLLTREQVLEAPGRPTLKMRYSVEVLGCKPWSVSLSLSQTLVLSRDLTKMLEGTTWSSSARQDEANIEFEPMDAIEQVVIAFVEAWKTANDPNRATETAETQ